MQAMLAGNRWKSESLLIAEDIDLGSLPVDNATEIERVPASRIAEFTKTDEHQGMAARMPPYPYATIEELLTRDPNQILVLDRIQYPMNFGTMLRSAEVFGVTDVIVPASGQSDVTASVARMSAGAVFHSFIAQVEDLPAALEAVRSTGIRVLATTPERGRPCDEVEMSNKVAVVIGRESDGVSPEVLELCDERVMIPQQGVTQSLNAAASAAIVLYEMSRQRRAN